MVARPKRGAADVPPPGSSVEVVGLEATQAIQNLSHDVPLVARKATVVRVYLDPRGFGRSMQVQGEIAVSPKPGAPAKYVASMNTVTLAAQDHPSLAAQRRDVKASLNFRVPDEVLSWPGIAVHVNRVTAMAPPFSAIQAKPSDTPGWQTIGIGLRTPSMDVDVNQFPGAASIDVRVLRSDGFSEEEVFRATKTF